MYIPANSVLSVQKAAGSAAVRRIILDDRARRDCVQEIVESDGLGRHLLVPMHRDPILANAGETANLGDSSVRVVHDSALYQTPKTRQHACPVSTHAGPVCAHPSWAARAPPLTQDERRAAANQIAASPPCETAKMQEPAEAVRAEERTAQRRATTAANTQRDITQGCS